jgi:hypothetical protein
MKKAILIFTILVSIFTYGQEKKIYRIYLKDNTTIDVLNPVKVPNNLNYETLDGNSKFIENSKYNRIQLVLPENHKSLSKYKYCELVGTEKFLSAKINVVIDYGENESIWNDNRIKDDMGTVATFNSMIDALNYMGEFGWEFAQAYTVTIGNTNIYHWLMKKETK